MLQILVTTLREGVETALLSSSLFRQTGERNPGYEPNDQGEWAEQPDFRESPLARQGAACHWSHREDADGYSQPGTLFPLMARTAERLVRRHGPLHRWCTS